ncbi:hypothetical protein P280DRAFT_464215 [Massarina eburnea CBS 473.64]|uniref:Ubiquitin 3 binding protein But2 C-terminal domain-containing protein n=1 Tax=Massarina eburnea CBS 473.64 TaxID=1395130 RepID=A0A6A6RFF3_9PLEO|nr:hypothetical protein P280DRAFT_464215 [Massarina eburnea CBS 473.64]
MHDADLTFCKNRDKHVKHTCGAGTHCPLDLAGPYEFPHLIVPVDAAAPSSPKGNQLDGSISSSVCTIYNFDIHPRLAGKTCSLVWLFPEQKDLQTSAFTYIAHEKPEDSKKDTAVEPLFDVYRLSNPALHDTTWEGVGEKTLLGKGIAKPGESWSTWTGECAKDAGKTVSFMLCGKDFELVYFQDFNPSPIGLYMRAC